MGLVPRDYQQQTMSSSKAAAPLSPVMRMLASIRQNGWGGFHRQMLRLNDAKVGTLVGTDHTGNKYYENMNEHSLRNRWSITLSGTSMDPKCRLNGTPGSTIS